MDYNLYVDDNVKHKRKKVKSVKKSNHKHDYKLINVRGLFTFGVVGSKTREVWTRETYECSICGKEKTESSSMLEKDFIEKGYEMRKRDN